MRIPLQQLLWLIILLLLGPSLEAKPNIVFIIADDLGWADLKCYGSTFHRTPHLDKLATQGLRFTDGYAACPVCSPTRSSIMTGKYPARLNLTDWLPGRGDLPAQMLARPAIAQALPLAEVTLADALRAAGYATGHIGKWHLGGEGFGPLAQGFESNIGGDHTGTPLSYFAPFARGGRFMPGLEKAPAGEYLTDRYTEEACRFIAAHKDRPFFLYLAHNAVHIPLAAKPETIRHFPNPPKAVGQQNNPVYAAMIESLDESVGRVMEALEKNGLADQTMVVFTSDNGGLCTLEGPHTPATINRPLREGKGWLYEGGVRVPLLVRWPGKIKAGSLSQEPVCSMDFFPTLLSAAGAKFTQPVDGQNLLPLLRGEKQKRGPIFWHYPHYANQLSRPGGAVRDGDWKLIQFFETGRTELFNLRADLSENQNLAPAEPARAQRMVDQLEAWRRETGAMMMQPNAAYRPHPPAADGAIAIHARAAQVHGAQLRYEPLPHKDTLGYWVNAEDWAAFDFTVEKPGRYAMEILQGCGQGQGGSRVVFVVGSQRVEAVVEDTGHFQNFKAREIGQMTFERPGRYQLEVRAVHKAKSAVMDLRQVVFKPLG